MVTADEGARAVRLARQALELSLAPGSPSDPAVHFRHADLPSVFDEPRGVFVTLRRLPRDELRGCIGYPIPVYPLRAGIPRVAVAAAREDPRFPPVQPQELPGLSLEVTLLSLPEPILADTPEERLAQVQVGRDGLIVDSDEASGLLLPQVPVEERWDAEQFLRATCEKAGLDSDAWRRPEVSLRRFSGEVFREPRLHSSGGRARTSPVSPT